MVMIGWQYDKNANDGWFCRIIEPANSVRTIEELLVEFVPQISKRCFQNFLPKANQWFVEILTTTYIFQSHSIYNISAKSCDLTDNRCDNVNIKVATIRRQPTLISLSIQIKVEDLSFKITWYEMLPSALLPAASKLKAQTSLRFSIAAGSKSVFWRTSRLENCNTYFALN